jgi:hypothetical protein
VYVCMHVCMYVCMCVCMCWTQHMPILTPGMGLRMCVYVVVYIGVYVVVYIGMYVCVHIPTSELTEFC